MVVILLNVVVVEVRLDVALQRGYGDYRDGDIVPGHKADTMRPWGVSANHHVGRVPTTHI